MSGANVKPAAGPCAATLVVCEDDAEISQLLCAFLTSEGYLVKTASDGRELEGVLQAHTVDLVILDWMLPGEDGLTICRRLAAQGGPPVLMLTARDSDADQVAGLETGADAYLAKPFNARVLLAHVRATLRRSASAVDAAPRRLRLADLVIDSRARRVSHAGVELALTSSEFDLLLCFAERPQRVLSRDELMDITRGRAPGVFDRTIDVQVSRLRHKLEQAASEASVLIRAVRNAGYILSAPVTPA